MHTALQQFDVKVAQRSTFYLQLVTEIISGAPAELSSVFHRATERESIRMQLFGVTSQESWDSDQLTSCWLNTIICFSKSFELEPRRSPEYVKKIYQCMNRKWILKQQEENKKIL